MDVVCFGQQNWDVCWTAKQHLMTRLARRGHRVLYVDPVTVMNAGSRRRPCVVEQLAPCLWRFTFTRYGSQQQQQWLADAARDLHFRRPLAVVLMPMVLALRDVLQPAASIYYAVDEWTAFGGVSAEDRLRFRQLEEQLLRHSDIALGVSPRLVRRFAQLAPHAYLQENGVDADFFAPARLDAVPPHPQIAALPRPRIGFVGQIDDRLDQPLLLHIARARPRWQLVLTGRVKEGVDVAALAERPNIHLLGYQPYAELPGVVREFDVCIVPYRSTSLSEACNPLKVYEYLATGRPVVSAALEGLNAAREVVRLALDPAQFIEQIEAALAAPSAGRPQRLAVARACDWERRTDELERRMNEALAAARPGAVQPIRREDDDDDEPPRIEPWRSAAEAAAVLHLDAKDEAERQINDGFAREGLSTSQRLLFHGFCAAGRVTHLGRKLGRWWRGTQPVDVQRILIVRNPVHVGDLVALMPMLAALRRKWPQARITLGTQRNASAAGILAGSNLIDDFRTLEFCSSPSRRERLSGMWQLFREGYDLLITGAWYFTRPEGFFSGAPFRAGLYDGHVLQRLCNRLVPLDANRHEADNNLAIAEALGCEVAPADRAAALHFDAQETWRAGRELLRLLDIPRNADIVTIHPGSKRHSRRWPAERFAAAIARLLTERPALHVVVTGVSDEHTLAESIIAAVPPNLRGRGRVHNAAGRTDMLGLIGLLDLSSLVISNDTGVMHLARARGANLLVLMGPENERRWGPVTPGDGHVITLRHEVPCAPCFRHTCENHYCMRSLTVQQVHDAANRLLNGHGKHAADAREGEAPPSHAKSAHADIHLPQWSIDKRRWSWLDLDEAGMKLPLVSVVLLPGRDDYHVALATLRRQDYPRLHVILILDPGARRPEGVEEAALFAAEVTMVTHAADEEPAHLWQRLRPLIRGEFIATIPGELTSPPDRLSHDVAAMLRSPNLAAVDGDRLATEFNPADPADPAALRRPVTFRAAALSQASPIHL